MTSYISNGNIINFSSETTGTYNSFYAFDNNTSTFWRTSIQRYYQVGGSPYAFNSVTYNTSQFLTQYNNTQIIYGEWLQITLNNPIALYSYNLTISAGAYPKEFFLVGSNNTNGLGWFSLNIQSNNALYSATYNISNYNPNNLYTDFRIIITKINFNSGYAQINELSFNQQIQNNILYTTTDIASVGIGTTNPYSNAILDVDGTILCRNGNSINNFNNNQLIFSSNGIATYMHAIKTRHNSNANDSNNAIDFYVWQTTDGSTTIGKKQVMSMTSAGVGIGITNPLYQLQTYGISYLQSKQAGLPSTTSIGSDGAALIIYNGETTSETMSIGFSNSQLWYNVPTNNNHYFYIASIEKFRIHKNGIRVISDINFYVDGNTLSVIENRSFSNTGFTQVTSGDLYMFSYRGITMCLNSTGAGDSSFATSTKIPQTSSFTIYTRSSGTSTSYNNNLFTVRNSGNVGIGTTNPLVKFDVRGVSTIQEIRVVDTANYGGNQYQLLINPPTSTINASIQTIQQGVGFSQNLSLQAQGGSVGIGKTNPRSGSKLEVSGGYSYFDGLRCSGTDPSISIYNGAKNMILSVDNGYYISLNFNGGVTTLTANNTGIGIGKTNPNYLLEVNAQTNTNKLGSAVATRFFSATSNATTTATTSNFPNICAYFGSTIVCAGNFAAVSDNRIKTNITDINDNSALQQILLLEPKTYNYINFIERGSDVVYGFLAQQVKDVFPNSVKLITDYIPNVYKKYNISNNIITTDEDLTNLLSNNDKIQIIEKYTEKKDNYQILEITSNSIKIDKSINYDECFIYGKEVDDFHTLSKEYIFTLNVCATQDLYKIIQQQQETINQLINRIEILENKVL